MTTSGSSLSVRLPATDQRPSGPIVARILLEIGAVLMRPKDPFILTSGRASPVYVDCRKVIGQGYPMRALRTPDYLYIRNFEPARAPAGDASVRTWSADQIATNYYTSYGDIDPGPTKAYLITRRDDPAVKPFFERAVGPRPPRELYSVARDPYQLENLAERPEMAAVVARLDRELMDALRRTGDPRTQGRGAAFDKYPTYNDPGFKRPDII